MIDWIEDHHNINKYNTVYYRIICGRPSLPTHPSASFVNIVLILEAKQTIYILYFRDTATRWL